MKKLTIAAFALAMTFGANAQTAQTSQGGAAAGGGAAAYGSVTVAMVTALGVSLAVATAIVANSQDVVVPLPPTDPTDPVDPGFDLICNEGDAEPVGGVCTNNGVTVTVTGTGTNTSTITVPVVTTYPAIVVPRP